MKLAIQVTAKHRSTCNGFKLGKKHFHWNEQLIDTLNYKEIILVSHAFFQKFYLMEAGDVMFDFYSEIFDKVRLREGRWKFLGTGSSMMG